MANIEKLEKLKKFIMRYQGRFYNQKYWLFDETFYQDSYGCGTGGCIAGNACLMEGLVAVDTGVVSAIVRHADESQTFRDGQRIWTVGHAAMEILGLTIYQANKLFSEDCNGWPKEAKALYDSSENNVIRAVAACMALDSIIEQEKARIQSEDSVKVEQESELVAQ